MRLAAVAVALALPTAALALSTAERMAIRSGQVLGAALGCGIDRARFLAVSRTTIGLIEEASLDRRDAERARRAFERTVATVSRNMARYQDQCATARGDFERAEAAQPPVD